MLRMMGAGGLLWLAVSAFGQAVEPGRVPEGLSACDWSSIRAAYEANRHAAFPIAVSAGAPSAYQAHNPGQQWRMRFDGRGFTVTPETRGGSAERDGGGCEGGASNWTWGLELEGYDAQGAARSMNAPTCTAAAGQRVEYEWDDILTEWYVNDQRGLEHGYTVHRRPEEGTRPERAHPEGARSERARPEGARPLPEASASGAHARISSSARRADELLEAPLRLTLAVRGDLRPRVSGDGRGVTFVNDAGADVINYAGLTVFDADGADVPAWFEGGGGKVVLSVDDRGARYPLTIDPVAQQAYLKASNTEAGDWFGISVAVSGDTVVVGAHHESSSARGVNGNQANNSATHSGAAYVFVRSGGVWSQQAYLKASNTGFGDAFGYSVAVSGDTVVVGAPNEGNNSSGAGAAYVFVRSGGVWSQQAYLKASNTEAGDWFGISVAVGGDTVVVGAYEEDSSATGVNGNQGNSAADSGAAYVFVRSASVWSQEAYLKASNTEAGDNFGRSVAVSGDTVVVGAHEDSSATGVNGNQANNSATHSGAAYVFVRSASVWSQQAYLKASNTGAGDNFGLSVAVSGDTVVVVASGEDSNATGVNGDQANNSATDSGAAYVFVRSGGAWSQQAYLKASNTGAFDYFGRSAAVSGDTVVVGVAGEDSNATGVNGDQADNSAASSGAAYVFVRSGGDWSQQAYLKASNTGADDWFGFSVAVSGDTVVVGAPNEDSSATGVDGNQADNSADASGAAYVFTGAGPAPCEPCDTSCDGSINLFDIDNFVLALTDDLPSPCSACLGDANDDGSINLFDIDAFVDCLTG